MSSGREPLLAECRLRRQTSDPASRMRRRASRVVSSGVAGVVSFLLTTIMSVTFGMLVFEPVPDGVASGVQMAIVGVSILGNAALAFTAQLPCVVVTADNGVVAPIVAQLVAQLAHRIEDPGELRATAVASVALCCTCFGMLQLLMTRLRLTAFVQYLPYSIPMGFLSGIGLELCAAISLAGGAGSQVAAAAFASVLCLGSWWRGWSLSVLFPVLLSSSIVAFYVCGGPSSWLLQLDSGSEGDSVGAAWLWSADTLEAVHWNELLWNGPPWLIVMCLLGAFQNCLFAELYSRMPGLSDPVTPDQVMYEFSQSFAFGGLLGFAGGFHNMACISLSRELKSFNRAPAGIVATLSCIQWLVGLGPILKVPRFVFAGLLLWVGLKFLRQYLWRPMLMLPRGETAVIVFVAITMKVGGFPAGVFGGLVLALAHMVLDQASVSCVQRVSTGAETRSNVIRSVKAEQLLLTHGQSVLVVRLAPGFVFFATSAQLLRVVEHRLGKTCEQWQVQDSFRHPDAGFDTSDSENEEGGADTRTAAQAMGLSDMVIDFTLCHGFDGSLVGVLQQMDSLAERECFRIRIAGLEASLCRQIRSHTSIESANFFVDMDHAMESVEACLLQRLGKRASKEWHKPGLANAGAAHQLESDDAAVEALGLDGGQEERQPEMPPTGSPAKRFSKEAAAAKAGYALLFLYSDASAASRGVRPAVAQASALLERHCEFFEASIERCHRLSQHFGVQGPALLLLRGGQLCAAVPLSPSSGPAAGEGVAVLPGAKEIAREVEREIQEKEARSLGRERTWQPSGPRSWTRSFSKTARDSVHELSVAQLWPLYLQRAGVSGGVLARLVDHVQPPRRLDKEEVLFHKGSAIGCAFFVVSGHLSLWNEGRGHNQEAGVPSGAMFRKDARKPSGQLDLTLLPSGGQEDKDEHHPSGGSSRLLVVGPGWALGEVSGGAGAGLRPQLAPLTCFAETEACVLAISSEAARQLSQDDPRLALGLQQLLGHFHALVLQHAAAVLSDWRSLVFSEPGIS